MTLLSLLAGRTVFALLQQSIYQNNHSQVLVKISIMNINGRNFDISCDLESDRGRNFDFQLITK